MRLNESNKATELLCAISCVINPIITWSFMLEVRNSCVACVVIMHASSHKIKGKICCVQSALMVNVLEHGNKFLRSYSAD